MIMIDIETLGIKPGAPIPTIGYCHFDWEGIHDSGTIAVNLEIDNIGKAADASTIKFWLRQGRDAIEKTFFRPEKDQHMWPSALGILAEQVAFGETEFGEGVWSNGPVFDLAHLEYWYAQLGGKPPWSHRSPRDCRTLWELASLLTGWDRGEATNRLKEKHPNLIEHDAENDAILQALLVIDARRALDARTG